MSMASANEYVNKMNLDENFRTSVLACKNAEDRTSFVRSEGFTFTAAEAKAAEPSYNGMNITRYGCCTSPDHFN